MNSYNLTSSPPPKKKKRKKEKRETKRLSHNKKFCHPTFFPFFFFCKIDGLPSNFGKNTHILALFLVLA
jgi:hypothetical protein